MAKIDDLTRQVSDPTLRRELEAAVAELKKQTRFGLVYENHLPEITALPGLPVTVGASVVRREKLSARHAFRVTALENGVATLAPVGGGPEPCVSVPVSDLVALQRFGEPIYPGLERVGSVERGGPERGHHAVINAENYHAVQLLLHLYEGQVDCLYLDPPYNTGARDWTYNNDYVDSSDTFRHSKWLSFMEKRLRLAKRLLKQDGVLIVTIDENEVHHLGVMLEQLFPDALRQMVTICINPSGVSGGGLSRVEEYAFFCFLGGSRPALTSDDMLNPVPDTNERNIRWESLMRGGNAWYRASRKNLCYPVILDKAAKRIVSVGEPFSGEDNDRPSTIDGYPVAWPVRLDGRLGIWRVEAAKLRELVKQGFAYVSSQDAVRGTWTIRYLMAGTVDDIHAGLIEVTGVGDNGEAVLIPRTAAAALAKTIWKRGRHTAGGAGGTHLLVSLLGDRDLFAFPKSVYAVKDCLSAAVGSRPNALVVDFFGGSGTTLNATCLLNAEDNGSRRCVLVTNNEVSEENARALHAQGHYKGDPKFEKLGIFQRVTKPRCEAAITGQRADGTAVPGTYIGGRAMAEGFSENVTFFRLNYLEPDQVDMGRQFDAIAPLLWLQSGAVGDWEGDAAARRGGAGFSLPTGARYGVLFRESKLGAFCDALALRPDVTHVYVVTNNEDAYVQARAALPPGRTARRLYRDYLRSFRLQETAAAGGEANEE